MVSLLLEVPAYLEMTPGVSAETEEAMRAQATVSSAWTNFFLSWVVSRAKKGQQHLIP